MSPADNMTPPKVGVMAPLQSAEIGVSNGVKIGRFWTVSQPLFGGGIRVPDWAALPPIPETSFQRRSTASSSRFS